MWFWLGTRAFRGSTLLLTCINDLGYVISNTAIFAEDTTLYSTYARASDFWQQLEFPLVLESDLQDTGLG